MAGQSEVPPSLVTEFQQKLQAISELAAYLGHADSINRSDQAEWFRTLLRTLADLGERTKEVETQLTSAAVELKALPVADIARAARITRSAVYLRAKDGGGSAP